MPGPATQRNSLTGMQGQQVQLVRDRLRLWINHNVHITRTQPAPMTKEPERKAARKLEPIYQHVATFRKQLFDTLFSGSAVRHIDEVAQRAALEIRALYSLSPRSWLFRHLGFNQNRK